ncbi:hypothetical protein FACS1894216_01460 [Synergistales bacterium]|nr:hypothetical protein FACS1894216_01460 [Synergistales bacterium]
MTNKLILTFVAVVVVVISLLTINHKPPASEPTKAEELRAAIAAASADIEAHTQKTKTEVRYIYETVQKEAAVMEPDDLVSLALDELGLFRTSH